MSKNNITIYSKNISDNIKKIKSYAENTEIIAVIKGNGYGHGLLESARACMDANVTTFALGDISEAILLRKKAFEQKLLLLFPPDIDNINEISEFNLIPTIYKIEHLELIRKVNPNIQFDLEVDTGIGRSGCKIDEVKSIMKYVKDHNLNIRAAYIHLYNNVDYKSSMQQIKQFKKVMKDYPEVYLHVGGSYTFCHGKEFLLDGIRVGLGLYGLLDTFLLDFKLKPAMEFNSFFDDIIELKKGDRLGYSTGFIAKRDTKLGLLNLGYTHGYPKVNKGFVKFGEKSCPIVGGINMMNICIDITDVDKKYIIDYAKHPVGIYSINPDESNSIMNLANLNGIIPNLYICNINTNYVEYKVMY